MRLLPTMTMIAGLSMSGSCLWAQESYSVGPRHLGMGGTGVATVDDVPAHYYNPAAYGFFSYAAPPAEQSDKGPFSVDNNALFRKDFGGAVDFSFGARIHKDFVKHVDTLRKYNDNGTFDNLGQNGINSQSDALALVEISNALGNLNSTDNAFSIDINAGVAVRVGHFGLGVRAFSQAAARLQSLDLVNLGVNASLAADQADSEISSIVVTGTGSALTTAQINQLTAGGYSATSINNINALATQAGIPTDQTQLMVDTLVSVNSGHTGTLEDNTSAARIYGAGILEIPLSYGYAINENWAIGGNLKCMIGRVYGSDVLIFKDDTADQLNDARDNYKQTVTWGLDLAVMFRMRMLQLGLTARNLNSPTFDGPTVGAITYSDYTLDPSVMAGVAFIPFETLTFAVDLDLTNNESILNNYDTQYVRIGGEWDIFRFFALRAGYSENFAEDDIGSMVHAGFGINLWAIRIDVAGAMSLDTTTYDGDEIPRESRLSAQIAVDF